MPRLTSQSFNSGPARSPFLLDTDAALPQPYEPNLADPYALAATRAVSGRGDERGSKSRWLKNKFQDVGVERVALPSLVDDGNHSKIL